MEDQLGGLRGNAGKKRMEHSWYAVVPQVIVPYGATAQKQEKTTKITTTTTTILGTTTTTTALMTKATIND